ncbi:MAG: hypothetical protein H6745_25845 [Deltaproteobacteria bacterium]|nr:hypothetical protein [Deltaproteobacteria bacterium]
MSLVALMGCAGAGDVGAKDRVDAREDAVAADVDAASADGVDTRTGPTCPAPALGAAGAAFGASDADDCFTTLAPGDDLEIVHGIQGGIHVLARVGAFRVAGAARCAFSVELVLDGVSVARFDAGNAELVAVDPGGITGATPAFPLVFTSADAALYHGRDAMLRGAVTVADERHVLPAVPVHLVDPALDAPSPPGDSP